MRPNFAQDAPPTVIAVGGYDYPCNVDYRVWIDVQRVMRDINPADQTPEGLQRNLEIIETLQEMVFGGILEDEEPVAVFEAMLQFLQGYPEAPSKSEETGDRLYSFEYDLNAIIIAIRNQSGIDLSYRRTEPFHWWEFLLEFKTLCGDHYILNLMDIRGYKGKDKEMLRRKRMCALPVEFTAEEQAEIDAFEAMFMPKEAHNDQD